MITRENECVGCEVCTMGKSCPKLDVLHVVCDKCGEEVEDLYWLFGFQLCPDCVLKMLDKVDTECV